MPETNRERMTSGLPDDSWTSQHLLEGTVARDLSEGLTVVVPAYNEEGGLPDVLADLHSTLSALKCPFEIVVVDDGSADGTAAVVSSFDARLVQHGANLGYGASLKTGIRQASYDVIVIIDADGTYPVERIVDLVRLMPHADMVVAARTGEDVRIPPLRRPAKWCLRRLAGFLTGADIPDLNSGLRCFRRSCVGEYLHLLPNGFSFTTTLTLAYHSDSRLVSYVPVDYSKRTGRSKIRPLRDSYNFLLLVLRTVMYFDPLRVLMPPALVSLAITIGTLSYEILVSKNLAEKSLIWLTITVLFLGLALLGDLIVKTRG